MTWKCSTGTHLAVWDDRFVDILVIMGFFLVYFCTAAIDRVFGVLLVEFGAKFPETSSTNLSSLGGVVNGLYFIGGPIATVLLNSGIKPRYCLFAAGIIAATGSILTAYVSKAWLLHVT